MSKQVRMGIVGMGIGRPNAKAMVANPRGRVTALCDLVPERMEDFAKDLHRVMRLGVSTARNRLMGTARRIRDPRRVLDAYRLRLDDAERTAVSRIRLENQRRRTRLDGCLRALSSLSPLAVLERGYSVVSRQDGKTVTKSIQVKTGDPIHVRLHQGHLAATVTKKK